MMPVMFLSPVPILYGPEFSSPNLLVIALAVASGTVIRCSPLPRWR
jgi:hypothetical protein